MPGIRPLYVAVAAASLSVILGTATPVLADPPPGDCDIVGTEGDDLLVGTDAGEVICGLGGNDVLRGGPGADHLYGGDGADDLYGHAGDDWLFGGSGRDRLYGGSGDDHFRGGGGPDRLVGGLGNDVLRGDGGRDTLFGSVGEDHLFGLGRDDRLMGGAGRDALDGGAGNDTCLQGPGAGPHAHCEIVPPVEPRNLAIAWSDLDGDHRYGPDDILIARLFDTNGDGIPSEGDTVYTGRYPLDFKMTAFRDWGVDSHVVEEGDGASLSSLSVFTSEGWHGWWNLSSEYYTEFVSGGSWPRSAVTDQWLAGYPDVIEMDPASPSQPETPTDRNRLEPFGNQGFIDVIVYP
jgi:Ca2+-binding RTX toxin-like protein